MSKQEKIKEVYGRIFDTHKQFIDEDGWFNNSDEIEYVTAWDTEYLGECDYKNNTFFRPKSLKGIENNRGWIKIESVEDLPKEDLEYWIANENGIFDWISDQKQIIAKWNNKTVTHYQQIQKPKHPIY